MFFRFTLPALLLALVGGVSAALAADVPGSSDHPLVGRFAGTEIVGYLTRNFDEAKIVTGPFDPVKAAEQNGPGFKKVAGRQTLIYYMLPQGISTLEVLKNYEASLGAKSFRIAFICDSSEGSCFESGNPDAGYFVGSAVGNALTLPRLADDYVHNWFEQRGRYMLAQLDRSEGSVYVAMYFGESSRGSVAVVRVVESKELELNKIVFINATEMEKQIVSAGRVNLYGILFDFDKDIPRPESKPTLIEIGKLMGAKPQLKLKVVGHTDDRGSNDYNLDLSRRRAANVVAALVSDYGIASDRLISEGAGEGMPIAPNETDEGRAKNRRVELISQ
jgi:outer membrane protein OmpA-like peptidoglycan-associated protein